MNKSKLEKSNKEKRDNLISEIASTILLWIGLTPFVVFLMII